MTTSVAANPRPRLGQQIRTYAYWAAAIAIIVPTVIWLGWEIATEPVLFFSSAVAGLSNGALYALIALGYTLVYGIIELINFAHGDLFMLGTLFSGLVLVTILGQTVTGVSLVGWLSFILALVAVAAFCASINVTIEFFAYRRLRRAPKLAPLITAVGISFILQWVGLKWNGSMQKTGWPSLLPQGALNIAGVEIRYTFFVVLAVTIPVLLLLTWVVTKTRAGKAMRATAQDQDAARLMGINVNRTISFTFAVGGALAGVAGVMYQQTIGTTRYDLGFQLGLVAFTAAVLGGIGNLPGAVLGGVLIGLIQGINDGVGLGQKYSATVVFTILILVMVFRPAGLLGSSVGEKV
ncbi:branched-chain amino acid ABC transporter permease [Luedemannella helvata]|uniref:Branched-chain amino acid ABC transporter permease n=1 Tax=Luedemannella helvata TaxID=349315 RepID=A0ABN2KTA8_9ACTN